MSSNSSANTVSTFTEPRSDLPKSSTVPYEMDKKATIGLSFGGGKPVAYFQDADREAPPSGVSRLWNKFKGFFQESGNEVNRIIEKYEIIQQFVGLLEETGDFSQNGDHFYKLTSYFSDFDRYKYVLVIMCM
jgi:hypothetical protein